MTAYYNEHDPYPAAWLCRLIAAGRLPEGTVDERSLHDVSPDELDGFDQCHFFAGIGGWPLALRLAGWPDERPVWTGSCPCQSFSNAGKRAGFDDPRHLWPVWFRLIRERRPATIFGEQVEAAIAHGWLDLVANDLEGEGYAVGAAVLPAAGIEAPHLRHRLWFVADAGHERRERQHALLRKEKPGRLAGNVSETAGRGSPADGLGDAIEPGLERFAGNGDRERGWARPPGSVAAAGAVDELADAVRSGRPERRAGAGEGSIAGGLRPGGLEHAGGLGRDGRQAPPPGDDPERTASRRAQGEHGPGLAGAYRIPRHDAGPADDFWRAADWLFCRDGNWRPVEPGTFPLAHGIPARMGRLRAYGNAIVPQVAAALIREFLDFTSLTSE
jgi:DNA (cytosine-5)-methyltransferase 1